MFLATAVVSFISSCFGGNETIAVVMSSEIMNKVYLFNDRDKYQLATDLSNTAILFAPLVPWNIAVLIPAVTWGVESIAIIPFAFYLYISFCYNYLRIRVNENKCIIEQEHVEMV